MKNYVKHLKVSNKFVLKCKNKYFKYLQNSTNFGAVPSVLFTNKDFIMRMQKKKIILNYFFQNQKTFILKKKVLKKIKKNLQNNFFFRKT